LGEGSDHKADCSEFERRFHELPLEVRREPIAGLRRDSKKLV
jgi:hypothetical protein